MLHWHLEKLTGQRFLNDDFFVCSCHYPSCLTVTANNRLCVSHGICITLRCLPPSPSLFFCSFSSHSSHNHYFHLCPTPPPLSFSPSPTSSSGVLPVVYILQAGVGWCFSPKAAQHLPFFTQGGWGERLPPDSYQQSYHCQRGQSQRPRYCTSTSRIQPFIYLCIVFLTVYIIVLI